MPLKLRIAVPKHTKITRKYPVSMKILSDN